MRRIVPFALTLMCLVGCGSFLNLIGGGTSNSGPTQLKRFASEQEFRDYFTRQVESSSDRFAFENVAAPISESDGDATNGGGGDGGAQGAAPPSDPSRPEAVSGDDSTSSVTGDHSQTTTQEAGVDEADVVKTDGQNLYLVHQGVLRIVRANPASNMELLSETELDGYGRELYLHDDRVVVLSETYGNYYFFGGIAATEPAIDFDGGSGEEIKPEAGETEGMEQVDDSDNAAAPDDDTDDDGDSHDAGHDDDSDVDGGVDDANDDASHDDTTDDGDDVGSDDILIDPGFAPPYEYERPRTIVTIIDISDPESPEVISTTKFEGNTASSRMIDGQLHLVLANYPYFYFDVFPLLGRVGMTTEGVDAEQLLPNFEQTDSDGNETSGPVLTWEDVYRPEQPDGFGVVSVVTVHVDDDGAFDAVGVVAEPGLIYSSINALYLTSTQYDFVSNGSSNSKIYKLAYTDGAAEAVAAGNVPGRVLNQYSMGEYEGFLRVATTIDPTFGPTGQVTTAENAVYVLEDVDGELRVVGSVEGIAPRETIQSCRFIGKRGYVVTFEQIDPLFTLDMSEPTSPQIVGELKVPGFSTFLTPMDEDHLLAVGQYISEESNQFFRPWAVQLSIFDVSDFDSPRLEHQVVIGEETGAYSEALYNPKALTYFAEAGLVALPISIYEQYIFDDIAEGGGTDGAEGTADSEAPPSDIDVDGDDGDSGSDGNDDVRPVEAPEPYVPGGFDGVAVFSVSVDDGFSELGRLSTRFVGDDSYYYWPSFARGIILDQTVYAVSDIGVRAAGLTSLTGEVHELFMGPSEPIYYDVLPVDIDVDVDDNGGTDDGTSGGGTEPSMDSSGSVRR